MAQLYHGKERKHRKRFTNFLQISHQKPIIQKLRNKGIKISETAYRVTFSQSEIFPKKKLYLATELHLVVVPRALSHESDSFRRLFQLSVSSLALDLNLMKASLKSSAQAERCVQLSVLYWKKKKFNCSCLSVLVTVSCELRPAAKRKKSF